MPINGFKFVKNKKLHCLLQQYLIVLLFVCLTVKRSLGSLKKV
jgi:hypothetical protein